MSTLPSARTYNQNHIPRPPRVPMTTSSISAARLVVATSRRSTRRSVVYNQTRCVGVA